jgi:hypothetical protein
VRAANSPEMRQREREFVPALPQKFHAQGTRKKIIHLPATSGWRSRSPIITVANRRRRGSTAVAASIRC